MKKSCMIFALLLGACGSHHHDNPQPGQADAFVSQVQDVINSGSEQSDPVTLDAYAATTPEDTEPVKLY